MATSEIQNIFNRMGFYIGFIAASTFLVFIANYQLDHLARYTLLLTLIPIPFISLFFGLKKPFIAGFIFLALGVLSIYLETNVVISTTRYIPGRGLFHSFYYTLFFIVLPLLTAGTSYIISAIKRKS